MTIAAPAKMHNRIHCSSQDKKKNTYLIYTAVVCENLDIWAIDIPIFNPNVDISSANSAPCGAEQWRVPGGVVAACWWWSAR